jgi:hypothetical protein
VATWADSELTYRQPISIPIFTGGGATTIDVQVTIPPDWDVFWNNILSNFYDIKIYSADGSTEITYMRATGANFATRTLQLQMDAVAIDDQSSTSLIYIYFGNSSASGDPASSFTAGSLKTGYIWLGRPVRVVTPAIGDTGRTEPTVVFQKEEGEKLDIWFDIRHLLASYVDPYNGKIGYEGIKRVQPKSLNTSGTDDTGRYSADDSYFLNGFASIRTTAGNNNNNFSVGLDIYTTNDQTYKVRCLLKIINILPTS